MKPSNYIGDGLSCQTHHGGQSEKQAFGRSTVSTLGKGLSHSARPSTKFSILLSTYREENPRFSLESTMATMRAVALFYAFFRHMCYNVGVGGARHEGREPLSKIRVLIVDDSRDVRKFVVECVLEPNGFEALEATDGAQGVRRVLKGGIDLVLLDFEMPKMDGLQVLDALRARGSQVPVILITSHGSEAIAIEVFRKGVRDYVMKPFTADAMLVAMEQALREVRLQREKEALTAKLVQTNRQLKKRLVELSALSHIGKSVTALIDRDKLLERVVEAALYIAGAEEGAILMADQDSGMLREYVRKCRVRGQDRPASWDAEDELATNTIHRGDVISDGPMLSIPLKVGGRPIGTLCASNQVTNRPFSAHERSLLTSLADYAAIAIENARLVQQIERTKEREKNQIRGMFERYVAPTVVEKLLAQPEAVALGGVSQMATILFADIRGFSNFSAHVTPKVLMNILNHHIAVAAQAILAERGTLDKFLGDAVMAYFNAPLPQPDHALRAVRAAWRLCRAVDESHAQLPSAHRLQFGVGVSTGEVLVGNTGAPQLMSYTVIGDTVNVSRRLQERAGAGQILICQHVYKLVQGSIEARSVGMMEIKGHPQPLPAFEVVAVHA